MALITKSQGNASPIACDLTAISANAREGHVLTAKQILGLAEGVRELPDGYAFRLPNETDVLLRTAMYIANERLCCPFFAFGIEIESEGGPLWLTLKGREGVKEFLTAEMGRHLRPEVAEAAGLNR
jgi:hypothetical protein